MVVDGKYRPVTHHGDWFELLWVENAGRVYTYAVRRVGPDVAPDVVADTFAVAWRRRGDIPSVALPWLYGVARRVISQHHRGEARHLRLVERASAAVHDGSTPVDVRVSDRDVWERALSELDDADVEALRLVGWEGLKKGEAAAVMGYSPGAFRVRLSRARRRLRKELEAAEADWSEER